MSNVINFVYVHARPHTSDAHGIFYVGKTRTHRRLVSVHRDNRHHKSIVNKYGKSSILRGHFECSNEEIANELERGLIKCLRKMGVKLTNIQSGGEGAAGMRGALNPATRPEVRAKISASIKALPPASEETRAKISAANTGKKNPRRAELNRQRTGWKHTEETKKLLSEKAFLRTPRKHTDEAKAKISLGKTGKTWIKHPGLKLLKCVGQDELASFIAQGWEKGRKL